MTQETAAPTPIDVNFNIATSTVTWQLPPNATLGTGDFNIQFVSLIDPSATAIPPSTGTPSQVKPDSGVYSQQVTLPTGTNAANYLAQVQAVGTTPDEDSTWGKQKEVRFRFSLSVTIGTQTFTLYEQPIDGIYKLPVSASNPLSISYEDLQALVSKLPGNPTLPTDFPNGTPINCALNLTRFVVDTNNKTFDFDLSLNLGDNGWPVIPGFSVDTIGLDIQRTDGTPLP
ncbi:MAG: hypothetical protein WAW41_00480 [Methylobacter sp.]